MECGCMLPEKVSSIQVLHLSGVLFDELFARLDLVAHECREELVGDRRGVDRDLQERPVLGIHRRIPQLVGVHLAEALEARDVGAPVGAQTPQGLLQLAVVVDVVVAAVVRHLVERGLRDVDVARLDQVLHVPVQEREHQRPYVAPVHIGVGHDDDLVVTGLIDVEALSDTCPYGADHRLYLDVGEDLVDVGLLDVEDLAPEGQYGLEVPVPPLLGRAASTVSLDDVELAARGVLGGAIRELARERRALEVALADGVAHLSRRLARPRGLQGLVDDRLGLAGALLEELGQVPVRVALDEALDLRVPELGLGLPLELRLAQLDGYDRRQPLPDVVAEQVFLLLLEEALLPRVVVYGPGQRGPEAGEVRPALVRVDVVREGEDRVLEARVPLHRDLDAPHILLAVEVEDRPVNRVLRLVYVRDEVPDAALVAVRDLAALLALVHEPDLQSPVEEGGFPESAAQRVEGELLRLGEDLGVGLEADRGPGPLALLELADLIELGGREPAFVALGPQVALAPDLELEPLRQGVDHRSSHTVQPAGDLVALTVELPAGVQRGKDDLGGRPVVLLHLADRHPAPVVGDGDGVVLVNDHDYLRAVPGERLVYGVVDDLPHEVVQPPRTRSADVHARPPLDGLETLQNLDGACIVGALGMLRRRSSPQRGPSSSRIR